jgi:hypothetical protein
MAVCLGLLQFPPFAEDYLTGTAGCMLSIILDDEASENLLLDTIKMFQTCYAELPYIVPSSDRFATRAPDGGTVVDIRLAFSQQRSALLSAERLSGNLVGLLAIVGRQHEEVNGARGWIFSYRDYCLPVYSP